MALVALSPPLPDPFDEEALDDEAADVDVAPDPLGASLSLAAHAGARMTVIKLAVRNRFVVNALAGCMAVSRSSYFKRASARGMFSRSPRPSKIPPSDVIARAESRFA